MDGPHFYAEPGVMTTLADSDAFAGLPTDPWALRDVVQGLLIHRDWQSAYGVELPPDRVADQNLRPAATIVDRVLELDARPLVESREPKDRVVGTCRDFAVVYTALLRRSGVPARARCGFGGYFEEGKWCDHWITERWNDSRWVRDDPQLDALQVAALKLDFDPADQPADRFRTGGEAWLACRGGDDTKRYGIFDMWGGNFIAGNVIRDLAALNKVELLPWDGWGQMGDPHSEPTDAEAAALDDWSAMAERDDLDEIRARYESDDGLHVPPVILSFTENGPTEVRLFDD